MKSISLPALPGAVTKHCSWLTVHCGRWRSFQPFAAAAILALAGMAVADRTEAQSQWLPVTAFGAAAQDAISGPTLGDRISSYLHLETSYLSLGINTYSTPPMPTLVDSRSTAYKTMSSTLTGRALLPGVESWDVYLRVGLMLAEPQWQLPETDPFDPMPRRWSAVGDEWLWGLGIGYRISPRWTGRLDFQQIPALNGTGFGGSTTEAEQNLLSIGISYDF